MVQEGENGGDTGLIIGSQKGRPVGGDDLFPDKGSQFLVFGNDHRGVSGEDDVAPSVPYQLRLHPFA